ncbi:MAG: Pvc16 family protein [Chloroflexia bacterium]
MLPDLDETLKQLFIRELPIPNGEVEISFDAPRRDWAAGRVKPTLNLYLYDLLENTELRRSEWVVERDDGSATKYQPPRRVNATYLVTAWAGAPEDEHRLLWRAMAVLMRHRVLPQELLQGELKATRESLQASLLGPEEAPNPNDLWSALGNELRPAFHYRVVLPLDVAQRFVGPMVFTKELLFQQGLRPGQGPFEEIWQIAGTVRDAEGRPVPGAEVRIEECGLATRTDAQGRYRFPKLDAGTYTLVVVLPGKRGRASRVSVGREGEALPPYDLRAPGGDGR